jgi:TolB protein
MTLKTWMAALMVLAATLLALPGWAQIDVRITEGTAKPKPIAIPDFDADGAEAEALARQVSDVVRNDLVSSGLFATIDENAFLQNDISIDTQPRFADWRVIKADNLVVGRARILADGRLEVAFRLWDNYGEQIVEIDGQSGKRYVTNQDNWRRIAHKIADHIYERLTGADPYFDSRIVYIAESGPKTNRVKRLAIMDSDGANPEYLTPGVHQVITPRFSPSAQEITYMSFERGRPRVYLFNIETGRQEVLGNFPGMTFAPRFSPDGRSVLLSQARDGNTDIFIMNLSTRQVRQLTDHPAIDTSPSMSPDGREIIFTSDRGGSGQIYIMNVDGSPRNCPNGGRAVACRLTFDKGGRGRYYTPVWSPRGDQIAFTKTSGGKFYIGVIRADGKGERLLTDAFLAEGPTWAPNGRTIAFFREVNPGDAPSLWSIDFTGKNLRPLATEAAASDPAWSPLLE